MTWWNFIIKLKSNMRGGNYVMPCFIMISPGFSRTGSLRSGSEMIPPKLEEEGDIDQAFTRYGKPGVDEMDDAAPSSPDSDGSKSVLKTHSCAVSYLPFMCVPGC